MTEPLFIHGLRAEDFLRLELVEIRLDGPGLTIVSGENAQGKSSLLRAIIAALGGKDTLPERPVREGADHADIDLDLGDKIVKRRIKPDGKTTLTVESKDGAAKYASPQKLLSELVGNLAFDPLEFAEQDTKTQATTLRKLCGIDTTELDARRKMAFDRRTDLNRDVKRLDAEAAAIRVPDPPVAPAPIAAPPRVSVKALAEEHAAAMREKQANDCDRASLAHHWEILQDAEAELVALREALAKAEADLVTDRKAFAAKQEQVAKLVDPDVDTIGARFEKAEFDNAAAEAAEKAQERAQRENAEAVARRALAVNAKAQKLAELKKAATAAEALTDDIAAIDAEKAAILAAAAFPCDGLGVDGDVVTYQGRPLSQASSAEQLRVCLAIAAAINPKLRTLIVRQGNDLDQTRLRQVAEWATDRGFQVLLERVSGPTPVGIVIEAGKVSLDARAVAP